MERLFDSLAGGSVSTPGSGVIPINLTETEDQYVIEAELPGVKLDQIEIDASETEVTLRGKRERARVEGVTPIRSERPAGSFERIITLPGEIKPDAVAALLTAGVLRIDLPKCATARSRRIAVRTA